MLRSPIAILPLLKQYEKSRHKKLRVLIVQALQRIVGSPTEPISLDVYLTDAPEHTRKRIREALRKAA
jgi:hypothetical protein